MSLPGVPPGNRHVAVDLLQAREADGLADMIADPALLANLDARRFSSMAGFVGIWLVIGGFVWYVRG